MLHARLQFYNQQGPADCKHSHGMIMASALSTLLDLCTLHVAVLRREVKHMLLLIGGCILCKICIQIMQKLMLHKYHAKLQHSLRTSLNCFWLQWLQCNANLHETVCLASASLGQAGSERASCHLWYAQI